MNGMAMMATTTTTTTATMVAIAGADWREHCCAQWQAMARDGITLAALQAFYARYKYLIMSRHIASYHAIGKLLADPAKQDLPAVSERCFELIMSALAQPATRGGDANALLHIAGYLKTQLSRAEKAALLDSIERYRGGAIALDVPVALLRAHFQRFPHPYIEQQWFLQKP